MTHVDALIKAGARQVSRKYRKVFTAPKPCVAWLRENDPEMYDRLVERTLQTFESEAAAIVWSHYGLEHTVTLTPEEFAEFQEKTTGKKPWTPEGKVPCAECHSLGHMHRRDCSLAPAETTDRKDP